MARKERNDIDYFPHSVNHGKKMFYIRDKFGNDGYAVWFMLLEQLGKTSYHYLDLSDEIQLMYLSSEFKVSEIVLKNIIDTLVKFGEFDKELWEENSILFNEKFIENISDAYKKRNNKCIDKNSLLLLLSSKGIRKPNKSIPNQQKLPIKGDRNPQSKVKESKEENTKEYKEEEKVPLFSFKKSLIDLGVEEENAKEFLKHRKKARAADTEKAFNMLKSEIDKSKINANDCIEICLGYKERSGKVWTGFKAEWLNNIKNQNINGELPTEKTGAKTISRTEDAAIGIAKRVAKRHHEETGEQIPYEHFLNGSS